MGKLAENMITIRLQGGLGNQLFQYATGRSLSLINKCELILDARRYSKNKHRNFELEDFNIKPKLIIKNNFAHPIFVIKNQFSKQIFEDSFSINPKNLENIKDINISGYFQSEKYFSEIRDILLTEITLSKNGSTQFVEQIQKLKSSDFVSVHVRKTDYLAEKNKKIYANLSIEYYRSAINIILNQYPQSKFLFFSDDPSWTRDNILNKIDLAESELISGQGLTNAEEIILMSKCAHNIIANSTFSWWGAWLNQNPDKIVISPNKWFIDGRNETDLIPTTWKKI